MFSKRFGNTLISIHALLAESDPFSRSDPMMRRYFYPRSPCGERRCGWCGVTILKVFLSTLSLRRATEARNVVNAPICISIHALLAESDFFDTVQIVIVIVFLSTLSLRRATIAGRITSNGTKISIHALLAESDQTQRLKISPHSNFYPRSPCGERPWARGSRVTYVEFLSTLSLRRATLGVASVSGISSISIHALLAESDLAGMSDKLIGSVFLSTLSLRRATTHPIGVHITEIISIHALLAESDRFRSRLIPRNRNFYPRSPCGERPIAGRITSNGTKFLSTLSLRRATRRHRGNDRSPIHFYPRSPCGERRIKVSILFTLSEFLSTLSLRRATRATEN